MLSELFATFINRFEESELQICLTVNLWTLNSYKLRNDNEIPI